MCVSVCEIPKLFVCATVCAHVGVCMRGWMCTYDCLLTSKRGDVQRLWKGKSLNKLSKNVKKKIHKTYLARRSIQLIYIMMCECWVCVVLSSN